MKPVILLFFVVGFSTMNAQTTINTAGGNTSGTSGSVSFSIGQTVYTSTTGADGSVVQGVQQPFVISNISGINEAKSIVLKCTAYPNPVTDNLLLTLGDLNELYLDNLYYQLIDINGKVLVIKQITGIENTVSMSGMIKGNYFLKVYSIGKKSQNSLKTSRTEMKTFKIIKK